MEVSHPRCAGLDVQEDSVVAAVRCYCMLCDGVPYRDLGPEHVARRDKAETIGHLVRRLRDLGCEVDAKHAAWNSLIAASSSEDRARNPNPT